MKFPNVILTAFLLFGSVSVNAADLIALNTRSGVKQKFLLIRPAKPIASVILFAGGKGTLNMSSFFGYPTIN